MLLVAAEHRLVLMTILSLSELYAGSVTDSKEAKMLSLAESVTKIEARVVDLTAPSDLFNSEIFRALYESPDVDLVLEYLGRPGPTDQQKIIAGLTLHKLPVVPFLRFAESALELLNTGKISPRVFRLVVFASYDWNTTLPRNYSHVDVSRFLKNVLSCHAVDVRARKMVEEQFLTGKAKAYLDDNQAP